jgi:hypothetical protein
VHELLIPVVGFGLLFRDRRHAGTHYTVCWKGPAGDKRCWHRTTGAKGHISRIGTEARHRVGSDPRVTRYG